MQFLVVKCLMQHKLRRSSTVSIHHINLQDSSQYLKNIVHYATGLTAHASPHCLADFGAPSFGQRALTNQFATHCHCSLEGFWIAPPKPLAPSQQQLFLTASAFAMAWCTVHLSTYVRHVRKDRTGQCSKWIPVLCLIASSSTINALLCRPVLTVTEDTDLLCDTARASRTPSS